MVFTTLKAARSELERRKITEKRCRHRIAKFEKHRPLCLHQGNSLPGTPYPCTCRGTGIFLYTIVLDG